MESSKVKITLGGKITDSDFYKIKTALQWISRNNEGVEISINCFFETQWEEYLKKVQNEKKGVFLNHKAPILTFLNEDVYIGDTDAFFDYALNEFRYFDKQTTTYSMQASNFYRKALETNPKRNYVFLNIVMSQEEHELKGEAQRVVIELFSDICPKTCENFKKLCNGSFVNKAGKKLSYEGAKLHRVVKGMYV
jgi:peptidyl-prolyl cis-trans isomerase-like 6